MNRSLDHAAGWTRTACDETTTVRGDAMHDKLDLFVKDQELGLPRAISDAFGLVTR